MSYDNNECNISGKVENFTIINTKTGTPMIRFSIACNKDRFTIVAFKALADATRLTDGDHVSIVGAIQSTSWEGKDGIKKHGFQFIASTINGTGQEPVTQQHAADIAPIDNFISTKQSSTRPSIQIYQGGPF
jgi:single-stranded DNA-binding protein